MVRALVLAACLSLGPAHAAPAEPLPASQESVTLEDVVGLLRRSPRVGAERTRVGVAEANRLAARSMPNPWFEYKGFYHARGIDTVNRRQEEYQIYQPIPLLGQRAARMREARHLLDATRAGVEADVAEMAQLAGYVFVDLLVAQERVRWLEETEQRLDEVLAIIDRQIEAGVRSAYDRVRVTVEVAGVRAELGDARADRTDAAGDLAALLGVRDWVPVAEGELPLPLDVDLRRDLDRAPALVSARGLADAASAAVRVARREMLPMPAIGGGWFLTDGWASQSLILALDVDLPFLSPGIGRLRASKAEAFGASLFAETTAVAVQAERDRALRSLETRLRALERFERDVIAELPNLRRMSEEAYLEAAADLIDLLDAIRITQDQRLLHVALRSDVARAQIDVLSVTGDLHRDAASP